MMSPVPLHEDNVLVLSVAHNSVIFRYLLVFNSIVVLLAEELMAFCDGNVGF